ncbi:MAG: phospholipase [Acidobacteria bacterium]|nr:phospholipase [Acidobacteriota bacterium]
MTNSSPLLKQIDHIVVLMLENRSFDNVLGWLYDPANQPPFDKVPRDQPFAGLSGQLWCNPRPPVPLRSSGPPSVPVTGEACAARGTVMTDPFPDPNEPYDHVFTQMFNQVYPKDKIPNTTDIPTMQGFVNDYADAIKIAGEAKKGCSKILSSLFKSGSMTAYDPGIIMNCFAPDRLPVLNGLANAYAVCDHWYSSVPTQTFPNRSFVHAATSSGYVYNKWKTGTHVWDIDVLVNKTPTIYNKLEEAGVSWRIYYGGPFLLCNALIIQDRLWEFVPFNSHFFHMTQFLEDAKKPGGLPAYTFIEPNMICSSKYGPENDMHPAYAIANTGAPTDVRYGEELVFTVYEALRKSPDWKKTLLVITFDEHGGTYDHVPPMPGCVSPDGVIVPANEPGGSGFNFKRYGVRVPTVLVSPLIERGTVCNSVFDHTSIIRTVENRWLGEDVFLTERDKLANDISEVLTPNLDLDRPAIMQNPVPLFTGCDAQPLSGLHRDSLVAAAKQVARHTGELMDLTAIITTEQAVAALDAMEERVRSSTKVS